VIHHHHPAPAGFRWRGFFVPVIDVEPLTDPGPGGSRRDGGEVAVADPTANPR